MLPEARAVPTAGTVDTETPPSQGTSAPLDDRPSLAAKSEAAVKGMRMKNSTPFTEPGHDSNPCYQAHMDSRPQGTEVVLEGS